MTDEQTTPTPADIAPRGGNHEAAKYRTRLREVEAERDALAANLSDLQRRSVAVALPPHVSPEHLWATVDLSDLRADRRGDAIRARNRIAAAQTRLLVPLRSGELDEPAFKDETRPIADRPTAAFPGGVVPDDLP